MKTTTDLFIRHFSFWPHLTEKQRAFLNDHTHAVRYPRGATVQTDGDCVGVLLIKTGQLRAYMLSEDVCGFSPPRRRKRLCSLFRL